MHAAGPSCAATTTAGPGSFDGARGQASELGWNEAGSSGVWAVIGHLGHSDVNGAAGWQSCAVGGSPGPDGLPVSTVIGDCATFQVVN